MHFFFFLLLDERLLRGVIFNDLGSFFYTGSETGIYIFCAQVWIFLLWMGFAAFSPYLRECE